LKQKPEEDRHFVLKNGLHKKIANNPRRAQAIYITRAGPRPGAGGHGHGGCQWGGGKYIICIKIDDVFVPFLGLLGICDKCGQGHDRAAARGPGPGSNKEFSLKFYGSSVRWDIKYTFSLYYSR